VPRTNVTRLGGVHHSSIESSRSLEFAPPALSELRAQADVVSDAPANRNGLDLLDGADHLEVHAGSLLPLGSPSDNAD